MMPETAHFLRLYVRGSDRVGGKLFYRFIVETARQMKMSGASVFPVELAYGRSRHWHDATSEYVSDEPPVVIEIVDAPERIEALLVAIGPLSDRGIATVRPVRVLRYTHADPSTSS